MDSYILLLRRDGSAISQLSPEEIQAITAKYKAWAERMRATGRLAGGEKLENATGRVMKGAGSEVRISDGPFTETKDVMAGFFVLKAGSYDEAVDLSRDCPHLEYGGSIELRRIEVV